jgi:hypothetical protein
VKTHSAKLECIPSLLKQAIPVLKPCTGGFSAENQTRKAKAARLGGFMRVLKIRFTSSILQSIIFLIYS